jgi:hypothetical protein
MTGSAKCMPKILISASASSVNNFRKLTPRPLGSFDLLRQFAWRDENLPERDAMSRMGVRAPVRVPQASYQEEARNHGMQAGRLRSTGALA